MIPADLRALLERAHHALADCPRGPAHDLADVLQALGTALAWERDLRLAAEASARLARRDLKYAWREADRNHRRAESAVRQLRLARHLATVEADPRDLCLWGCEYPSRDTLIGGALRE